MEATTARLATKVDWITLSGAEPEKHSQVLVTTVQRAVRIAEYRGNGWWVSVPGAWTLHVIAWAQLPWAFVGNE